MGFVMGGEYGYGLAGLTSSKDSLSTPPRVEKYFIVVQIKLQS